MRTEQPRPAFGPVIYRGSSLWLGQDGMPEWLSRNTRCWARSAKHGWALMEDLPAYSWDWREVDAIRLFADDPVYDRPSSGGQTVEHFIERFSVFEATVQEFCNEMRDRLGRAQA